MKKNRFDIRLFLAACATALAVIILYHSSPSFLRLIDNALYDSWIRSAAVHETGSNIVIAKIDERSLQALGQWPWPRAVLGQLVTTLDRAGARVASFDVIFPEPSDPDNDRSFADAIRASAMPVVLGCYFHFNGEPVAHLLTNVTGQADNIAADAYCLYQGTPADFHTDIARFSEAVVAESSISLISTSGCHHGFFNTLVDPDGMKRSAPGVIRFQNRLFPSLAVVAMQQYLGQDQLILNLNDRDAAVIEIGATNIPLTRCGDIPIKFRHPADRFSTVSVSDILAGQVEPSLLKDRIVIVGATAVGLHDECNTPIAINMPGVYIHAFLCESILAGDFIRFPARTVAVTVWSILSIGLLSGLIFSHWRHPIGVLLSILLLILCLFGARWVFLHHGIFLSPVYPALTVILVVFTTAIAGSFCPRQ